MVFKVVVVFVAKAGAAWRLQIIGFGHGGALSHELSKGLLTETLTETPAKPPDGAPSEALC